jgi:hypothetical protein
MNLFSKQDYFLSDCIIASLLYEVSNPLITEELNP